MMFFALSGLINGLAATFLGLFVLSRKPSDSGHRIYAFFCLSLSVWSYAYFAWLLSQDPSRALFWVRILIAGAIFIPPAAFHHLVKLVGKEISYSFLMGNYSLSLFLFLSNWGSWIVQDVRPKLDFPYWPDPGALFHLHLIQIVGLALLGLWVLKKELQKSEGLRRNQIKFLIAAEMVGWSGGFTNYPLWYDIPIPPYGNILVSVYTAIFAYAMVRYRLLDVEIVIKRSLIYAFNLLVLLIPCYLLVVGAQLTFFGRVSFSFSLVALVLFICVGFLFPRLRFRTEEAFERVLFKRHYDYRDTLLRSSRDMVSMVDLEAVCKSLVLTVVKALRIDKASLYLLDDVKGAFGIKSSVGIDSGSSELPELRRDETLVQRLTLRPTALVREELEMARDGKEEKSLAQQMAQMKAEVTLPLVSKERVIALLNLGHKEGKEMYSDEDLELLSTLANQAAIAIENARLYENLKQSQSIIRRADRLASLGQLTAGLAHEIRNPLVAIRTFTQLLPQRYQDPEFRNSFQALAMKEVDRICGLVNDLLSFARPSAPNVSTESINEIVESIARILETEAKEKGVQIYRRLAPSLPKIFVDKEQIKQVCMNVILNGIQAIDGKGVVQISTQLFAKNGDEQFVQIGVRDSGTGISEKDLENIFNPFFTTKKEGSGLGLSISHQIVQEHGGYIVVESRVGDGTTFFINLPVAYRAHQGVKGRPQLHEEDPGR